VLLTDVYSTTDFSGDLAQTKAMLVQQLNFHRYLVWFQGCSKSSHLLNVVYQVSIAGVYQITIAADNRGSRQSVQQFDTWIVTRLTLPNMTTR